MIKLVSSNITFLVKLLWKQVVLSETVDEILWCDHLSESHSSYSWALLFYDIVLDTVQYGQYFC